MTDLRDKIARALHRHATDDGEVHILWGGLDEHEAEVAEWQPYADAVLAVLDKVRAEAWDEGFDAGQAWESDMNSRIIPSADRQDNPYRKADQ